MLYPNSFYFFILYFFNLKAFRKGFEVDEEKQKICWEADVVWLKYPAVC